MSLAITYLSTPLGWLRLEGESMGLSRLDFVEGPSSDTINSESLQRAIEQLNEYFEGTRKEFKLYLSPSGTHFQKNVWAAVSRIPYGATCSYEDIAKALGDIKVIRAAAAANGRNPLPIVIPCHRIIGKDGSLTGYSGGLWRKKWLLELESREKQPTLW
ncbi:MAG TPA: methylated-DNA--[protein]-cysteine S-methyltransferase [Flavobacteriales bacterium]